LFVSTGLCAWGSIIHIPGDQPSIQAGIDAASPGDTILADPGVYYENINFREKGIVVASRFLTTGVLAYIDSTVINGSAPAQPDSASCVRVVSDSAYTMNDTMPALIGFTITGGTGTKWTDEHGAGLYREGGGILIQYLSPRIRFNLIRSNRATDTQGCSGAGGGAIRCGDGFPWITNNVIMSNAGGYGGGIVLNYTGAVVRNNVIACDSAGGSYGAGGGIWVYGNGSAMKLIENNVIAFNMPGGSGAGGVRVGSTSGTILRNNIVWGNGGQQLNTSGATVLVRYNDIQGGFAGEGNLDAYPAFTAYDFYLSDSSPAIDAGDTNSLGNDPEDPNNSGHALWPARGLLRNDMGAYGGPDCDLLPAMPLAVTEIKLEPDPVAITVHPNPFRNSTSFRLGGNDRATVVTLKIYDASGRILTSLALAGDMPVLWEGTDGLGRPVPAGLYFAELSGTGCGKITKLVKLR
jgi:hypothetical protein